MFLSQYQPMQVITVIICIGKILTINKITCMCQWEYIKSISPIC